MYLLHVLCSIAGVQLFGGKFFKCVDSEGNKLSHTVVKNKTECIANNNFSWVNSKVNFDNVLNGYLALFQVVSCAHTLFQSYVFCVLNILT